jgi:hypothetical protein
MDTIGAPGASPPNFIVSALAGEVLIFQYRNNCRADSRVRKQDVKKAGRAEKPMDGTYATIMLWVLVIAGFAIWHQLRASARHPDHDGIGPWQPNSNRSSESHLTNMSNPRPHVRGLGLGDRDQYIEIWKMNQARYADDPRGAILEAETLINMMMRRRGYRLKNLDRVPADTPRAHDRIVGNYLAASEIVSRYRRGQAGAEDLCKAMVCYRALFDQLLDVAAARR